MQAASFNKTVLTWFDSHGRKNLPWQFNRTAYRVWLSEVMLQQTQVSTVIPYFERFTQQFKDVSQLAAAPQDEVLHLWSGLGYYSRARNLHKAAQMVTSEYGGVFPSTVAELEQLPGVGRSTAGAIASIAYGQPAAILDGNVKRVLARVFDIEGWAGTSATSKALWHKAEQLTAPKRCADYSQAMMDLGATLCTRSNPRCDECPFTQHCLAKKFDKIDQLPGKKPRKNNPVKSVQMPILRFKNQIVLYKRPATGIWGGLWSLPELPIDEELAPWLATKQLNPVSVTPLAKFRHTFSHYHLDIQPILIELKNKPSVVMEDQTEVWYKLDQQAKLGLPAPISKLLNRLP